MLLFLISLLLIGLYLVKKLTFPPSLYKISGNKIPGPKALPIVGNALQFGLASKSLFQNFTELTKEYGPIFRVWLGPKLMVCVSDPDIVQLLISGMKYNGKASVYAVANAFGERGLLVNGGEIWKLHRKIIAPTLVGPHLTHFLEVFNSNLDTLIERLSDYQNGPSFDVFQVMCLYTLDVISESAMGVKLNFMLGQESEYLRAVNCVEDIIFRRIFLPWLHPDAIFNITPLGFKQAKCLNVVLGLTRKVIDARKQQRSYDSDSKTNDDINREELDTGIRKKKAYLDSLLDQMEQGAELSDQDLQDEVNTLMAAGHDTTAASLSYTCWLLAQHQEVQDKVVEELRHVFGDSLRHATTKDLNELNYLERVVKEALRIFPPIPIFGRHIKEDLVTDNYIIPAGTEVGVNVYMLHRHPHHFPDPERFDPDRFLPENCENRHPYAFVPFSAGPRICVGHKFAMQELKATLSKLLRHFKILPPENPFQHLDLNMQLVLKSQNGVRIKLQPRKF